MSEVQTHPGQVGKHHERGKVPQTVTMRAYEVYCHLYGKQEALVTGCCRGGFGVNELVAFLYAYSFPKNQWQDRVDEALIGMEGV